MQAPQNWDYEQRQTIATNFASLLAPVFSPRVRPKHATPRHEPTMPAPHKQVKHVGVLPATLFDATSAHLKQFGPPQYGMDLFSPPEKLLLSAPLCRRAEQCRGGPPRRHGHVRPKLGHVGHICQAVLGSYTLELKPRGERKVTGGGWGGCMTWITHLCLGGRRRTFPPPFLLPSSSSSHTKFSPFFSPSCTATSNEPTQAQH